MDLKKFVQETLVQIARGVEGAQSELANSGAVVNPRNVRGAGGQEGNVYGFLVEGQRDRYRKAVQAVSFDVVVSAVEGATAEGGGRLRVGIVSLGGTATSEDKTGSESRIQFKVPIILPFQE